MKFRMIIFSLRTLTLIALLFLLINPWVSFKQKEQLPQQIDVIFDLSESVKVHFAKDNILPENIKTRIDTWSDRNRVDVDYYRLGNKIKSLTKIDSVDMMTDFTNISSFIAFEKPDQVLLITDGIATVGIPIDALNISDGIPIHILGVGSLEERVDLAIESINISQRIMSTDTVNLVLRIQSRLSDDVSTKLQIINANGNNILELPISFKSGSHQNDIDIFIPALDISGLNTAKLFSIEGESQIKNNNYSFSVDVQLSQDNIVLISGALSPNTASIRSIIKYLDEVQLNHYFRFDPIRWNKEPFEIITDDPKIIILDDFPIGKKDKSLFDKIVTTSRKHHIPIVYLEGPKSNLTSGEIIRSYFPDFIPTVIDADALTPLSDDLLFLGTSEINLSSLPPQKRSIKWMMNEKKWATYSDASLLVAEKNNFFMIAIPDISGNHLKMSVNYESMIYNIIKKVILHAFYGNEGFLNFHVNSTSYNKGEVMNAYLFPVKNLGISNYSMIAAHPNKDTIRTDCDIQMIDESYNCDMLIQSSGKYIFWGEAFMPDGNKIISNKTPVVVQDVNIELRELIQDQNALMRVAYNSGGLYETIELLDTMFSHIEINPVQIIKNHQISGLSSQNYWWILIVLLASEWLLRKKLGLL